MARPRRIATTPVEPATDGRQRRSERSREAIVQALFELVGDGVLQPTAQQVAEAAGVGIRSVFRHFQDMEGLFAELDVRVRAAAEPIARAAPLPGRLETRVRALVERRVLLFERIAPYKRFANVQRWRSEFVQSQLAGLARDLRADLLRWLPELGRAPADLVEALDVALSFEVWDRLRTEQRLGRERAREALLRTALALGASLGRRDRGAS